jgi:hypothetical protein
MADKLLFILVYQKTAPLQVRHGLQFGLSQGQVNHWIHRLLPVLQASLAQLHLRPEREGAAVADAVETSAGGANLSLDGTQRRVQRPGAPVQQRAKYSGKKKIYTKKNLVLINEHTQHIVYLSPTVAGKTHDKKLAESSAISYPAQATVTKDSGFQGYEPAGVLTAQPKKAAREGVDGGGEISQPRRLRRAHHRRKCDLWHQAVSHRQRHVPAYARRFIGRGDGNCVWVTQSACDRAPPVANA